LSGDYLITGSWDKTIKIHQIYTRKLNVETLEHGSQITAVAFHPEGKQFAAATIKGEIYIWQI
jgi:periodic tryptophan protein 2